jgi:hypothetical protein
VAVESRARFARFVDQCQGSALPCLVSQAYLSLGSRSDAPAAARPTLRSIAIG